MFLKDAFSRSRKPAEVKPGDSYRRDHSGLTEIATVLDLRNDPLGIPHVRFSVRLERNACAHIETAFRVLALGAFQTAYPDRLV